MFAALSFLRQVRRRLLRHRQWNAIALFVPLAVSGWALSRLVLNIFTAPPLLALAPPILCAGWFSVTVWKMRTATNPQFVASLVDDNMGGKERFLTLVTTAPSDSEDTFYSLIQRQAEQLAVSFSPKRDLALTFDKRIPWLTVCAVGSMLLLIFCSSPGALTTFSSLGVSPEPSAQSQEEAIATLEAAARRLLAPTATPQEQLTGAQLSTLLQQLKDPSLTPQEKQKSLEDAQKRFSLNSPLPQLFPLDLKIFTGKGNDEKGQGDHKGEAPQNSETPLEKSGENSGQSKQSPSPTDAGNETNPGSQQTGDKQKQPQPRQSGGGVTFNFPQPEGNKQGQSPQKPSNTAQKPSQPQTPESRAPGADPNPLGAEQQDQTPNQNVQEKDPNKPGPGQEQKNEKSAEGASVGMSKGERFSKPGEQAGGGFLTKDARFVKVRVPVGLDEQAEEDGRTTNTRRTSPTTPYSNAPLKESPLDPAQPKQPIPLEYRSILSE